MTIGLLWQALSHSMTGEPTTMPFSAAFVFTVRAFLRRTLWQTAGLCALAVPAAAAPPLPSPPVASAPLSLPAGDELTLTGQTLRGQPFSLAALRGKVVLVYFWATDCPICLNKMPELRANVSGWKGKPFELVTVHLDRQREVADRYWYAVGATASRGAMGPVLWRGAADYHDSLPRLPSMLPFSVLINAQGKVVASFEGRIPPEVWDQVAELLP